MPFSIAPGGDLADADLSSAMAAYELRAPLATRGAAASPSERLFAARCRSVVLVVSKAGEVKHERIGTGTGSRVKQDGHVLTAAHVVAGAEKVIVGVFPNCDPGTQPKPVAAKVVKVDQVTDLALLRLAVLPRSPVFMPLGQLGEIRTGTTVTMIGHLKGLLMSNSHGLVRAIRPGFKFSNAGEPEQRGTVVQTDGAINPGNSGGPILLPDGNLVGVNSFILGQASAGLNFAVSVNDVREFFARTENRYLQREPAKKEAGATAAAAAAAGSVCKVKVVSEWEEDDARYKLLDIGRTRKANGKLSFPKDSASRGVLLWDRNGDGGGDVRYFLNRAGAPEYSEWDDDFDGTYDYRAEHERVEWKLESKLRIAG